MARRAARTDANHKSIADFFKAHGCEVESLAALGKGVADLLVSACGEIGLVEVKDKRGRRTPAQVKFAARFPVFLVRTDEHAAQVIAWLRARR